MKKLTFIAFLCLAALSLNAQLKVNSDGKVYIQRSNEDINSTLSIGYNPVSLYNDPNNTATEIGVHVQKYTTQSNRYQSIGVFSEAGINHAGSVIGVWGHATGGSPNSNTGVLGTLDPSGSGAGIMGTTEGGVAPPYTGAYAAYFYGETYSNGDLTVDGSLYNYSDMRLKTNVESLSNNDGVLNKLWGLDVFSYNLTSPSSIDSDQQKRELRDWEKQAAERIHYGVSAQELQQIFPALVKEGQDGYLKVNYTEMVPLLLCCIQKLKQQLDEVKDVKADETAKARGFGGAFEEDEETTDISDATAIPATASLSQNVPNPFTERTTIRFTLPDDTRNASICIFDMSGKMLKQVPVDATMHSITIEGYEFQAGMYIYSLLIDGKEVKTRRMILSK